MLVCPSSPPHHPLPCSTWPVWGLEEGGHCLSLHLWELQDPRDGGVRQSSFQAPFANGKGPTTFSAGKPSVERPWGKGNKVPPTRQAPIHVGAGAGDTTGAGQSCEVMHPKGRGQAEGWPLGDRRTMPRPRLLRIPLRIQEHSHHRDIQALKLCQ